MFRFFKNKKDIDMIDLDEREELLNIYIRKGRDLCYSHWSHGASYLRGGKAELQKLIEKLVMIYNRVNELETKELVEKNLEKMELLNK